MYEDDLYYSRQGIDVSNHQGHIDWDKVKAAGYDFAFIRLGYRGYGQAGSLNSDKLFDENVIIDRDRNIIKLIMPKPTVQSALFAGCIMPKLEEEERAYLTLANMLFGGFFGSRLMANIREEKGYTYGIHSSLQQHRPFLRDGSWHYGRE